jgi:hypothetical protein
MTEWLNLPAILSLGLAILCALIIAWDIVAGHRQRLLILRNLLRSRSLNTYIRRFMKRRIAIILHPLTGSLTPDNLALFEAVNLNIRHPLEVKRRCGWQIFGMVEI